MRGARLAVLASLVAFGGGLALGAWMWRASPLPDPGGVRAPDAARADAPRLASTAAPRALVEATVEPSGAPDPGPGVDVGPSSATWASATLEVRVRTAEGAPVEEARVYALPAGAPGADGLGGFAAAETGADGIARVPIAGLGTYDVRAWGGNLHAMALDVPIESSPPLLDLVLPPTAEIEVEVSADALERTGGQGFVDFRPVHDRPVRQYPGRGDPLVRGTRWPFGTGRVVAKVARGERFRIDPDAAWFPLRAEPEELVAPGRSTVVTAGGLLQVRPRLVPADRTFDRAVSIRVLFSVEGEDVLSVWETLDRGRALSTLTTRDHATPVPSSRGVLRWTGSGVAPGEAPFDVGPDGHGRVDVTIDVVAAPAERVHDDPPRSVRVDVTGPASLRRSRMRVARFDAWQRVGTWVEPDEDGRFVLPEGDSLAVACGSAREDGFTEYVSEPVERPGEGTRFVLARGGFVVLVPSTPATPGLTLLVARADGGPLAVRPDDPYVTTELVEVEPGLVVGPLLPGPVRLALRLGGVDAGEVSVVVREGEYVPLTIRPRR